ncbi:MAG: hypothetical protein ACRDKW_12920, partial [Actinomycetota bacterium]
MTKPRSGGTRPAWAPSSWEAGEIEELDMQPYDLARRVREHTGEGLIELDEPPVDTAAATGAGAGDPVTSQAPEGSGVADASTTPDGTAGAYGPGASAASAGADGTAARIEDVLERFLSALREQIAHRAQSVGSQL